MRSVVRAVLLVDRTFEIADPKASIATTGNQTSITRERDAGDASLAARHIAQLSRSELRDGHGANHPLRAARRDDLPIRTDRHRIQPARAQLALAGQPGLSTLERIHPKQAILADRCQPLPHPILGESHHRTVVRRAQLKALLRGVARDIDADDPPRLGADHQQLVAQESQCEHRRINADLGLGLALGHLENVDGRAVFRRSAADSTDRDQLARFRASDRLESFSVRSKLRRHSSSCIRASALRRFGGLLHRFNRRIRHRLG